MQNSSPHSHWSKAPNYFNPISKIRSLIQNLDAELMQLCKQCTIPPKVNIASSASQASSYVLGQTPKRAMSLNNLNTYHPLAVKHLAGAPESQGSPLVRTLASVYRAKVIDAYRNRRIFTVFGNYHTIRRALLRRGWLEKLAPGRYPKLQTLSEDVLLSHARRGNDYEAVAISKIINHFPAFFIWQPKALRDIGGDVRPMRNRVRRSRNLDFSTKVGLIGCAEQEQWYRQDGISGMSYPRFYRLGGNEEDRMAFINDHRQTQCRCLLKFVIENCELDPDDICDDQMGKIDFKTVHFAHSQVKQVLGEYEHVALDEDNHVWERNAEKRENEESEWQNFMTQSSLLLNRTEKLRTRLKSLVDLAVQLKQTVEKIEQKCPDYKWDGCRNLWILKPGYQSRGMGIIIRSSVDDILQWSTNYNNRRYICQKYVERPMLIYKTKFDIRQYMLLQISDATVSIWLYKDCYLRFSSQEFSIDDLREAIHLTNNSVQKRYKNKPTRDQRLPKNNMWSLEQFKAYLGFVAAPPDTWDTKIFHGFRENLVAVVMASLEETDFVENAFELYGCDFMLDESYNPILIEINSTPDLSPSTEVTARICPNALRDCVRVIVDLPHNPRALTGLFDRVYEVNYKIRRESTTALDTLELSGKRISLTRPMRTTIHRQKVHKRVVKADKKKAPDTPRTPVSPKTVKRIKKAAQLLHHKKVAAAVVEPPQQPELPPVISGDALPLKTLHKEALALRYTVPK